MRQPTATHRLRPLYLLIVAGLPLHGFAQNAAQPVQRIEIIGASPVGDTGVPVELYPANVQTFPVARSAASGSSNLAELLGREAGSVNLNDTEGNAFQVDLNYRGFTASPILGTPQGLSVFLDGVRVNEPFGDVVSWDLVPQIALSKLSLIPGTNPVYGMNTLGGALALKTKTGFDYEGIGLDVSAGSFHRISGQAEYGHRFGDNAVYLATSLYNERGWAVENPSRVHHFLAAFSHHEGATKLDLTVNGVSSYLAGNQLVPFSSLDQAAQGYTRPDYADTRAGAANLRFSQQLAGTQVVEGNVYYRRIARTIFNSNVNDPVTPGQADQATFCQTNYGEACASNVDTQYTQRIWGLNLQVVNQAEWAGRRNYFTAGGNFEHASTGLTQTSQDAVVTADRVTQGSSDFVPQSDIGSTNRHAAAYATDTLVLTPTTSLTASLRYDRADISLGGTSVDDNGDTVDVSGSHRYQRLNPALGGTFVLSPAVTLFANYAEGFRAPSAIELACADAAHPCAGVPNAFSADPDLQAVVARNFELGARGRLSDDVSWRAAAFRTNLQNDIQFNQSTISTGYFSNVGDTRRTGLELSLSGANPTFDYGVSATWQKATFESAFAVANTANADPSVLVQPGDRMPGVPELIGKARVGWYVQSGTRLEGELLAQGSQYSRGNENNLPGGQVPGFATVKLAFTQRLTEQVDLYGGVTNLFDRRYANFGMLGNNAFNGANGTNENFWGVGQPRAFYLGVKATL